MADIQTTRDTSKYNLNIILKLILKTGWEGAWIEIMSTDRRRWGALVNTIVGDFLDWLRTN
jgi:hypothetical protein